MMGLILFFKHMIFIQGCNVKMDEMLKKLILGQNEFVNENIVTNN